MTAKTLPIVKIGHPVLRKKTEAISLSQIKDIRFQTFLRQMVETMHEAQGVGLAANQVGRGINTLVLECDHENERYPDRDSVPLQMWMNARIVKYSKRVTEDWEGCLSIPGYRGLVPRAEEVTFEAVNEKGENLTQTVSGFHARIIQHEVDHLNGLFYVDRMKDLKSWTHVEEMRGNLKEE